mgnify:CR=1 FL=1
MSEKNQAQNGKKKKSRAIPWAIAAFIGSAILDFSLPGMLITVAAAYGIGKLIGVMSTPLDTTTHNKQDQKKQPQNVPMSGDTEADSVISKGKEMLVEIRKANDAIPDPHLSSQMDQLEDLCIQLFTTVAEKPNKAPQLRKFMNYYLPTTLKMLNSYRTMQDRGVSSTDLSEARRTLSRGMDMILLACQKQLDNLYKDTMLDVSTDIDVLEQMLKRDGFTDTPLEQAAAQATSGQKQAATAAAAQMATDSVPVLHTPDMDLEEDFSSYYHQKKSSEC